MIRHLKPLIAIMFVLVMPNTIRSQNHKNEDLEKKTVALLNDIASAAYGLKVPENRLFVMSNTADLLWTIDEKRARNLYWEALNTLAIITPKIRTTGENISKAERLKILEAYMSVFNLRGRLLRQVAQRDAGLALEMLRATRQVAPRLALEFPLPDDRQLEQEIAVEVAERDPAYALQLARESLAKGLTLELIGILHRLNQKDAKIGSEFADAIINKLRTISLASDLNAARLTMLLLESSRQSNEPRVLFGSAKPLKLTDEQRRDLVDLLTNAALGVSAGPNLLFQMSDVMPEIQEFFPERHVALERKLTAIRGTLPRQVLEENTYNNLVRNGSPEEIIRVAANASRDNRIWLYHQAASTALMRGTADSFRELVNEQIKDEGEQRETLDTLDSQEINLAMYRKQLDHLRDLLPKVRRKEERARAMAELALMLKEKGEDAEAESLLDEAATLIKTDLKSETQTNALLSLLCAYAVVDPPKAFALAEQTVDQANDQISMLMLIDRVVKSGAVKKNEILLEQPGVMPLSFLVFRYGKGVAALARADFNRTKALADRFDRNELRLMARLLVVKGILTPEPVQN